MLTKAVVFLFSVIAVFGLIISNIPADFTTLQASAIPTAQDKAVSQYFDAANITVYTNQKSGILTYLGDAWTNITAPGTTDQYIELYWDAGRVFWTGLYAKHAHDEWYGRSGHDMVFTSNGEEIWKTDALGHTASLVQKADLIADFKTSYNGSYYDFYCDHIVGNILYQSFNSTDIGASYDSHVLGFKMSYEVNLNATSLSMWTIIAGLFTFKPFNLGIGGFGDILIGGAISAAFWALVCIVLYKTLTGIIPWLSGGSGD